MMRCHICGRMLDTQDLGQYFNEVLSAHYYTVAPPRGATYIREAKCSGHTEGTVMNE